MKDQVWHTLVVPCLILAHFGRAWPWPVSSQIRPYSHNLDRMLTDSGRNWPNPGSHWQPTRDQIWPTSGQTGRLALRACEPCMDKEEFSEGLSVGWHVLWPLPRGGHDEPEPVNRAPARASPEPTLPICAQPTRGRASGRRSMWARDHCVYASTHGPVPGPHGIRTQGKTDCPMAIVRCDVVGCTLGASAPASRFGESGGPRGACCVGFTGCFFPPGSHDTRFLATSYRRPSAPASQQQLPANEHQGSHHGKRAVGPHVWLATSSVRPTNGS